jgi:RNA polymerase sigma-70 factor, ECF subfamily
MQDSIQRLAAGIVASDSDAFNTLFRTLFNELVRFAYRYTNDTDTAKNVVQDVFVKLWQTRSGLDPERFAKSYLFQMVRNKALNEIRDRRKETIGLDSVNMHLAELYDEDEDDSDTSDLQTRMRVWIDQLPDRQREAFELSRFEGLDHDEIARVMELSARTVNNHIVAALKNLRAKYDIHTAEKSKLVV